MLISDDDCLTLSATANSTANSEDDDENHKGEEGYQEDDPWIQ